MFGLILFVSELFDSSSDIFQNDWKLIQSTDLCSYWIMGCKTDKNSMEQPSASKETPWTQQAIICLLILNSR